MELVQSYLLSSFMLVGTSGCGDHQTVETPADDSSARAEPTATPDSELLAGMDDESPGDGEPLVSTEESEAGYNRAETDNSDTGMVTSTGADSSDDSAQMDDVLATEDSEADSSDGFDIAPDACSLQKLELTRCLVPGNGSCGGMNGGTTWSDSRGRTFTAKGRLVAELTEEGNFDRFQELRADVQILDVGAGEASWRLGYMLPGVAAPTEYCYELPAFEGVTLDDIERPRMLRGRSPSFPFADECGNLTWLSTLDGELVGLGVVGESWQLHRFGQLPDGLSPVVDFETTFSRSTGTVNYGRDFTEQRGLLTFVDADGNLRASTYSMAQGWTESVVLSERAIEPIELHINSYSYAAYPDPTIAHFTETGQAYAAWSEPAGDSADEPARLRAALISSDGVASEPFELWRGSDTTRLTFPRVDRFRDGRERIVWTVQDDEANVGTTWVAAVGQGMIGAPEQVEEAIAPDRDVGDPGRYGIMLDLNATEADEWRVVVLTRRDADGHAQPVQILSDDDADAMTGGVHVLPSGDLFVSWIQFEAHQWEEQCPPGSITPTAPGDDTLPQPIGHISPEEGRWVFALIEPDSTATRIDPCDVPILAPPTVVAECY